MPTNYAASKYIDISDTPSISGGTLSWNNSANNDNTATSFPVVDSNDDGNLDINSDYFAFAGVDYTGYYITFGGKSFGVYDDGSSYYIPHNGELDAFFAPGPGSTSVSYSDNFVDAIVVCFLTDTHINSGNKRIPVQDLNIGDKISDANGNLHAVKFVFKQSFKQPFVNKQNAFPICIKQNAISDNVPRRDLFVSPAHALMIDGHFMRADTLVNGVSIFQVDSMPEEFTYYHIELATHELIMAEGAAAETSGGLGRNAFDNYDEYIALYGQESVIESIEPRIKKVDDVPASITQRLLERATLLFPEKVKQPA